MEKSLQNQFLTLWRRYFNSAELPLAFEYADEPRDTTPEPPFVRHRCMVAQLIKARNGRTLCLTPESLTCRGAGRYLNFRGEMFPGFTEFLSHDAAGGGERYLKTPMLAERLIGTLPILQIRGRYLIIKRWDMLGDTDRPDGVIFFATPDTLSGLFTLASFGSDRSDAVIAPFGSGCATTIYAAYREQITDTQRAVIGTLDPSARKCIKGDLLTFAVPYNRFVEMIGDMEESFLGTHSWEIIQRRIR